MTPKRRLLLLAGAIGAAFGAVALGLPRSPEELRGVVEAVGPAAPVAFALAWAALTPALCSGTLLAIAGGLAFGTGIGTVAGVAGGTLGGVIAFLIARAAGRDAATELAGPRLRSVSERVERRGFLAVLCARLAPGVPATLLNYACGLSGVRVGAFAAAICIGSAPRVLAYTAIGASGGALTSLPALLGAGLLVAMALAGGAVALRRRLRPALA